MDDVGALICTVKSNTFSLIVNMVRSFSSFSGFNSHTILPYVTFIFFGTCFFGVKINVFVTFTFMIPWTNCPSSFANECYHLFLFGTLTICLYSWATPDILCVTVLNSLTFSHCAANANFGTVFFLKLDIKLELGPPVSTLGGCTGLTLGVVTGTYGIIMCGTEGGMWTFRWKYVGLFPSSSSMMLVRSAGICLAHFGRILWGVGADFVKGCFCGGCTGWCRWAATLKKIPDSCSISTIWESTMLENGAWDTGFCGAWANSFAVMMTFYEE